MILTKPKKIALAAAGVAVFVLGLLWYFQSQDILRVFPSARERAIKQALKVDESKFRPAVGLSDEDFKKAIAELYARRDKAQKNHADPDAWFRYGYQLEFLNDHEGAIRAWEIAFGLQPLNFQVAGNLANTLQYFIKDYPKAEEYYLKALDVQPMYTAAWQGLGDLYRYNWKEKQNLLERAMLLAVEKDPANRAAYYSTLTGFFYESGNLGKAREYYSKVRAASASTADGLLELYPHLQ